MYFATPTSTKQNEGSANQCGKQGEDTLIKNMCAAVWMGADCLPSVHEALGAKSPVCARAPKDS
jgi:hypothetical protein